MHPDFRLHGLAHGRGMGGVRNCQWRGAATACAPPPCTTIVRRPGGTRRRPWALPGNGGNRQEEERIMADIGGIAADRLRTFVERIERLEEEKAAITADIREVYAEAKGAGFNAKILRQIVRLRRLDQADRREEEAMLELYKRALDL